MQTINFIISEQDPDGRTCKVSETPIAIFQGESKEGAAKHIIRIIAKHLAHGDYTLIAEKEALTAEHEDAVKEIVAEGKDRTIFVDDSFIKIAPVAVEEDTKDIPIVKADAYDSAFIYASPFIVRGADLYAVDSETGVESGPYSKADNNGGYYLVYSKEKWGVVSPKGQVIADCIYDRAYNQLGYATLEKDGKLGCYSPYAKVLIPCEYDYFEYPDDNYEPINAFKDGVHGRISTDGVFYTTSEWIMAQIPQHKLWPHKKSLKK